MNSTIDTIHAHRSIRAYTSDPISDELLESVLTAATMASTGGNRQTYSVIVTRDEQRKQALWSLHQEQDMILQAPVLLTFCADWNRMTRWCLSRDAQPGHDNLLCFTAAVGDVFIAAQNAVLAAEAQGLGICYMGTTLNAVDALIEFFGLPKGVFPVTSLVLGYPAEKPSHRKRLPLSAIVHNETYGEYTEEQIDAAYGERDHDGWQRHTSTPELAREIQSLGITNLAQVYTQLKHTKADNERDAVALICALRRQGFLPAE
ncbi:MAG: nitroreductase [Planctomycetota bacterium]